MSSDRPGFFARQFSVPEVVRSSTKHLASVHPERAVDAYRVAAVTHPEPSQAERLFVRALWGFGLNYACPPAGLFFLIGVKREALAELIAIAEMRRSARSRHKAVYAYWIAQIIIWIWWLFLVVYVACGLLVALLFATGLVD